MRKTPAIAARILAGALAVAAHAVPAQTPESPGAAPVNPGAPSVESPAAVPTTRVPGPAAPEAPVESPGAVPPGRAPRAVGAAATPRAGEVVLNFQGADLQAVVKAMSQMTGRNMLIDPRGRGQVTIVPARPPPAAAGAMGASPPTARAIRMVRP